MTSDEAETRPDSEPWRPILGTPDEMSRRPARRGKPLSNLIIGVIVAVMAGGWGYVMLISQGNPEVRAEVISFDTSDPAVAQITFTVHKPADQAVTCRVRALDVHKAEVGSRVVDLPSGKAALTHTEELRTSAQAALVQLDYCDLV